MVTTDKHVFFFRKSNPFSNGYPCTFICNIFGAKQFNCVEQYMMYSKAKLFDQNDIADDIMKTNDPYKHKALGRSIPNFDNKLGFEYAEDIVYDGLFFKFTQNQHLIETLFSTGNRILVEASPSDKIGGVGLDASDHRIHDESNGKGKNLLGKQLMILRKNLFKSQGTNKLIPGNI